MSQTSTIDIPLCISLYSTGRFHPKGTSSRFALRAPRAYGPRNDRSLHLCVGRYGSVNATLVGRALPGPYCRYIFPLVVTARWSLRSGRVKTLPYGGNGTLESNEWRKKFFPIE